MLKNKRSIKKIAMLLLFLIGALTMSYPFYVDSINHMLDQWQMSRYEKEQTDEKKREMEKKNVHFRSSGISPSIDPFDQEKARKHSVQERDAWIGRVNIPNLNVEIPLFDHTTEQLLEKGATVLQGTSFPTGEKGTHAVISAHRGLSNRKLFTDLPNLKIKEHFFLDIDGKIQAYEVDSTQVVRPNQTDSLRIAPEKTLVTLVTCTPYMINSHRLLVTGHRVPYTVELTKEKKQGDHFRWLINSAILLGISVFVLVIVRKIKKLR